MTQENGKKKRLELSGRKRQAANRASDGSNIIIN
jgi:hypothetical protein